MSKNNIRSKRAGAELNMRTFRGKDGRSYLVFQTGTGSFHAFVETEAKQAARECGASIEGNTRQMWTSVWKQ